MILLTFLWCIYLHLNFPAVFTYMQHIAKEYDWQRTSFCKWSVAWVWIMWLRNYFYKMLRQVLSKNVLLQTVQPKYSAMKNTTNTEQCHMNLQENSTVSKIQIRKLSFTGYVIIYCTIYLVSKVRNFIIYAFIPSFKF